MQMKSPGMASPERLIAMAFFSISTFSSRSLPSSADLISCGLPGLSRLTIIEHDFSTASAMMTGGPRPFSCSYLTGQTQGGRKRASCLDPR